MKRILYICLLCFPVLLIIVYCNGPKISYDTVNNVPHPEIDLPLHMLDSLVIAKEEGIEGLKPDNEATIVWHDSLRKTEYAIVYLHGFSASRGEGKPLHLNLAKYFGANLYLTRLPDHGVIKENVFLNISPKQMVDRAKEAIAIGKRLGEKVILMSCSTGSTLSMYLSAGDPSIHAEIMVSPNVGMFHPLSSYLNNPWGLQLARKVGGGLENVINYDSAAQRYWTDRYRWEGVIAVQELIEQTMHREIFGAISHPIFCGYYYKDEKHQDKIIDVASIQEMREHLSTPSEKQRFLPFANGTRHVIISPLRNPNWEDVQKEIISFCEDVLAMTPV